MPDEPRDPSLEEVLALHRDVLTDALHVMIPGVILSYDATLQKAVAQPAVKRRYLAEDGETVIVEDHPAVHECPVEFCGTARGRITWPVAAGDTCEIRFSSSSIARWIQQGGVVDPADDRRHDLSDGVVFVGLHDFAHVPTDAPTDAVVVHVSGGVLIKLGDSSATLPVTRTDDVQAALVGALTDASILDAIYTYGSAPPGPGKVAALAAVVVAVNGHFTGQPVEGSTTVRAT